MKIVLIAYHFPPDPSVGAVRAGKVASALAGAGHTVDVIAPRLPGVEQPEIAGVKVHRVAVIPNAREVWAAVGGRVHGALGRNGRARSAAADRSANRHEQRQPRWKRWLLSMLFLPDDRAGFILPAARRAARLCDARDTIVYTTAPPFSTHVAGLVVQRVARATWVAEYRDPWILPLQPILRSRLADRLHVWLRDECVARADALIAVSHALCTQLSRERTTRQSSPAFLVRNGIDVMPVKARSASGRKAVRSIGYFGHLYMGRDPRPFLRALARLRKEVDLCSRVRLDLYGNCRYYNDISVGAEAERLGIADLVHFHGELPRDECLAAMQECDLLLLFAQQQPLQVPNKLYDYLGAGRPIIALADAEGETATMLGKLNQHFVVTTDDEISIQRVLAHALKAADELELEANAILAEWSAERQMGRLVSYLENREWVSNER